MLMRHHKLGSYNEQFNNQLSMNRYCKLMQTNSYLDQSKRRPKTIRGDPSRKLVWQDTHWLLWLVAFSVASLTLTGHNAIEELRHLARIDISSVVWLLWWLEMELDLELNRRENTFNKTNLLFKCNYCVKKIALEVE